MTGLCRECMREQERLIPCVRLSAEGGYAGMVAVCPACFAAHGYPTHFWDGADAPPRLRQEGRAQVLAAGEVPQ